MSWNIPGAPRGQSFFFHGRNGGVFNSLQYTVTCSNTTLPRATNCNTLHHNARGFQNIAAPEFFCAKNVYVINWNIPNWNIPKAPRGHLFFFLGVFSTHCNTLQHTATHCNTLQHTATHCNTLQHTATHCNTLQHTINCAKRYGVGQVDAAPEFFCAKKIMELSKPLSSILLLYGLLIQLHGSCVQQPQCCSVLQCAAVCCSVLQCVAVCCSVLQCVAVCVQQPP